VLNFEIMKFLHMKSEVILIPCSSDNPKKAGVKSLSFNLICSKAHIRDLQDPLLTLNYLF
jgi:hypothetical protein